MIILFFYIIQLIFFLLVPERNFKKIIRQLSSLWSLLLALFSTLKKSSGTLFKILNQDSIFDYLLGKTRAPFSFYVDYVTFPTFYYYLPNLHRYTKAQSAITAFLCQLFYKHNENVSLCKSSCNFFYSKWTEIGVIQLILK